MYRLIAILVIFVCTGSLAAQTITWEGGTPGRETTWDEPGNWDKNRVPTEDDKVIIRMENNGHFSMPVIVNVARVAWVEIQSGASLTITETGQLTVDGRYIYSEGITLLGGLLKSDGNIVFLGIDQDFEEQFPQSLVHSAGDHSE